MRLNSIVICSVLATASVSVRAVAQACDPEQLHKPLANNGAPEDRFGISVSVDGPTAIVGAYQDDDNGDFSGSAYLFDVETGAQLAELLPNDGEASELFGWSVAIDGPTAIVGARGDDDNGVRAGSAYLFDVATGVQLAKLLPGDGAASDTFGDRVAVDGSTVIAGAQGNDDNGSNSGSAYLFDLNCDPLLTVSRDPLVGGQEGVFTASHFTPGVASYLAYSVRGPGSTYVPSLNVTLDLDNPRQAGTPVDADADGQAQWTLRLPTVSTPVNLWLQACQFETKTDIVETQIVP